MTTINMHPGIDVDNATMAILSLDFGKPFTEQVKGYVENNAAAFAGCDRIGLVGQSVGAMLLLPAMEMINGLPLVATYQPGQRLVLDWVNTARYRHEYVRPRRDEIPKGDAFDGITVLDGGGRGLTPTQLTQVAAHFDVTKDKVRVLNVSMGQVNMYEPTCAMVDKIITSGLTTGDALHPERLAYVPGGAGLVGVLMGLTVYGLTEMWPQTVRLNKVGDEFVVAEVVSPQDMRQWGVQAAARYRAGNAPVSVPRELFDRIRAALVSYAEMEKLSPTTETEVPQISAGLLAELKEVIQ